MLRGRGSESTLPGFADAADGEALRFGGKGDGEALDGFVHGFVAEAVGLVVDGNDVIGANGVCHGERLFRGAVVANPGIVSADGHNGGIEWAARVEFAAE